MVFCSECGAQGSGKFCSECGTPLAASSAPPPTSSSAPPPAYGPPAGAGGPPPAQTKPTTATTTTAAPAASSGSSWKDKLNRAAQKTTAAAAAARSSIEANQTFQNVKESAARASKKAAVAVGVKYSSAAFAENYDLPPNNPLLASAKCSIANGPELVAGQMYITPGYLCLYMVLDKEVKPIIAFDQIASITECVGKVDPEGAPYTIEPTPGEQPRSLQVYTVDRQVHTFINVAPYVKTTNLISYCWNYIKAGTQPLGPPVEPQQFHTDYGFDLSERELRTVAGKVVTGPTATYTQISVSINVIAFKVGEHNAIIPIDDIATIVRCYTSINPEPGVSAYLLNPCEGGPDEPKANAVQIYTHDNVVHQMYNFEDYMGFVNLLTYIHSRHTGAPAISYIE